MDNFLISLNAILPLTFMMGLGYLIKKAFHFSTEDLKKINGMCFKVFLPLLLFRNIYQTDIQKAINLKLMSFAFGITVISFVLLCVLIPLIEKDRKKTGVLIQGIFRSNFIIFGLPITLSLYGEEGAGVISLLTIVVIPIFNILAVMVLEMYEGEAVQPKRIFFNIIKNPLILGVVSGVIAAGIGLKLPLAIEKTISDVSQIATPLSLIVLGGSFTFRSASRYAKQLVVGVVGKLVILPLVGVMLGVALGFRGVELLALILLLAPPAAVSSFTMAQQMDTDHQLAAHLVVWGSVFSSLTVFLWIFVTKQVGLL